jgi:hypothetical protein
MTRKAKVTRRNNVEWHQGRDAKLAGSQLAPEAEHSGSNTKEQTT